MKPDYDVIVVGGRAAGASLAIRLGARGLSVLVVDKAEFPSHPEVPSCPIMYSSAMMLFDEIGFHEADYEAATTRVHSGIVGFEGYFQVTMKVPMANGRDYLRGFDRARFDNLLWKHLEKQPNVTCRSGFTVNDLVRDLEDRVVGIVGTPKGGVREQIGARLAVVGADGRHSVIARKAGARVLEEQDVHTSTIHFAEWENLVPATPTGEAVLQIVSTGKGRNVLFFPSCEGRVSIATHGRTDRAPRGDAHEHYLEQLKSLGTVRKRIDGARQIGPLLGVRRIANRYRDCGGPGWLLVGDALHHKDPIDGQGIRDALMGARILASLLADVHEERLSWRALLVRYQRAEMDATHDMYLATMERLSRDLYTDPPPLMIKTLVRWALQDPAYQKRFLLFLARVIPPNEFRTPSFMAGVVVRGVARDLRGLL